MNKRIIAVSTTSLVALFLFSSVVFAAATPGPGFDVNFHVDNPLKAKSLECLLYYTVNGIMSILGIVAALAIIYSGFLFVSARGSEKALTDAKRAFFNAIIGTALLLGAWAITIAVVTIVNEVTNNPTALPSAASCT